MSYYLLEETIRPCDPEDLHEGMTKQYVAVLTTPEWVRERDRFDMGIELEPMQGIFIVPRPRSIMTRLPVHS